MPKTVVSPDKKAMQVCLGLKASSHSMFQILLSGQAHRIWPAMRRGGE